jgi:hypothetical protein
MTQLTSNTTAFIEAQQYSQFIIENLEPFLLPEIFWRDVSDFQKGTTLNIKTIGDVTLQEAAEDVPLTFNPIDTGNVTLTIADYVGDAWAVSDDLRLDGSQIDTLMGQRAMESTRAFAQHHETRFLATAANSIQTLANVNLVNSVPHRWVAGGAGATNRVMTLEDMAYMQFAFDEADVPAEGRIAIVPPVVALTLGTLTNIVNVSNNPMFEGLVQTGFSRNHKFVTNVYGWDVWTSTRLPAKTATEALDASTYSLANDTAEIGDKACIFMSIADDQTKPVMHAWRSRPSVEGWREHNERKDKFQAVSRFGFGGQRSDSLGVIWVHPTNRS